MIFDLGYGLTAISYTALVLLLLTVKNAGFARHLLLLATVTTVLWALGHVSFILPNLGQENILLYDAIRQGAWILFLAGCLRNQFDNSLAFIKQSTTLISIILPLVAIACSSFQFLPVVWQFSLHTLIAVQTLVMTELVYRQSGAQKWAFKPLVIFLGSIGLMDFVIYANASMLNTLSWDFFAARGYILFALMPLLVVAIRRIKHWGIDIFVSREVVMHSTLLLLAGVYLMFMGLLGYLVKFVGGNWSFTIQMALVVVSLALLAALFMSHQVRATIKIFITKHFYANQYDYRAEWVKLTKTLAHSGDEVQQAYSAALRGWMEGLGYDFALLYKKVAGSYQLVSEQPAQQTPKLDDRQLQSLLHFFEQNSWIIDSDELAVKPDIYQALEQKSAFVKNSPYQIFLPIVVSENHWGFVALGANETNKKVLNWELRDYLNALSDQIGSFILNAENSVTLAENAQFAAFNRMSAFVVHDLKNVLAQINLILSNAKEHKHNPEFIEDTFETLQYTQERMDKMLKQLMQKTSETNQSIQELNLYTAIEKLIETKCKGVQPLPEVDGDTNLSLKVDADKILNVLYHLISNAQQATKEDGFVKVSLRQNETEVHIAIADNGMGMSEDFIQHRLFKPFDTTKGNAGMGIGAYDAKNYIEECGGRLTVDSTEGNGSVFHIVLPKV
ncbi:XrtA/PEP-CTERM system histidine kinase PrsK [Agaribacter flavus]|uniref:histidine kinase n=1 Tax=Agaribacter flavus TaxID=1902781 RepID=A0ABV7FR83_9ALTE